MKEETVTGLLLTLLGSAVIYFNQLTLLYFNSKPDFSVSGGGTLDLIGIITFFCGIAVLYYSIVEKETVE